MATDKWWLIERLIPLFSITICCVLLAKNNVNYLKCAQDMAY